MLAQKRRMHLQERGTTEGQFFSIRQALTVSWLPFSIQGLPVCTELDKPATGGQTAVRQALGLFDPRKASIQKETQHINN